MDLPEAFRLHLKSQNASPATQKNYVADVNNFIKWLHQNHDLTGQNVLSYITPDIIEDYKKDLQKNQTPLSTINRRLSALRKLSQFIFQQGWLKVDPLTQVENIRPANPQLPHDKTLLEFAKYLTEKKTSQVTIKNYLSDIKHFLGWLETTT